MNEKHIVKSFDRDLEAIQAMVMKMGGMVETAILDAAQALETRDEDLAEKVRQGDKAIDAMEERVHEEAARLLALRAPAASDLRTVLSVMRIAASLERVGDYAKNMAKRSHVLGQMTAITGAGGSLRRMSKAVVEMLGHALDAYIHRDVALAEDVRNRDREVDQMYNALFREFLTHMMEDPRNITACTHLLFCAKNLERIGDHVTNIAENAYYTVTGEQLPAQRPKQDETAMAALAE